MSQITLHASLTKAIMRLCLTVVYKVKAFDAASNTLRLLDWAKPKFASEVVSRSFVRNV